MRITTRPARKQSTQGGDSLLSVLMAMLMLSIGVVAAAGVLGSTLSTSGRSKGINYGARFLEDVMASVQVQPPSAILAMNGNVFYDHGTAARSQHRVELTASHPSLGLVQVEFVLRHQSNGAEIARVATFRGQ